MKKIKVNDLEYEEYWAPEQVCPYCKYKSMHKDSKFCSNCGKSFENIEWTGEAE